MKMKKIKLDNFNEISVSSLPHDMLLVIFEYLDEKSLKVAVNVCKSWSQVIKSSSVLGRKFTIKIHGISKNNPAFKNCSIDVPIEGMMYKKLHITGYIPSEPNNSELCNLLQNYRQKIEHVVLENFKSDENFLENFQNISKLEIIADFDENLTHDWSNLSHLELRINSLAQLENFKIARLKLKTFKISIAQTGDINNEHLQNFNEFLLTQKEYLQELSIRGIPLDSETFKEIFVLKKLNKIKLEIEYLEVIQQNILVTIATNQKWKNLIFLNPKVSQREVIIELIEKCQDLRTLRIMFTDSGTSLSSSGTLFEEIVNFKSGKFSFSSSKSTKSITLFENLDELSIKRIDNEGQLKKLIKFLEICQNLEILKLNLVSNRANFDKNFKEILETSKNLREIHIDAYSEKFDVSAETFDFLKQTSTGLNLRKLVMEVESRQVQKLQEKLRKLLSTKIQTIVMGKEIRRTCLENYEKSRDYNNGICIFMM